MTLCLHHSQNVIYRETDRGFVTHDERCTIGLCIVSRQGTKITVAVYALSPRGPFLWPIMTHIFLILLCSHPTGQASTLLEIIVLHVHRVLYVAQKIDRVHMQRSVHKFVYDATLLMRRASVKYHFYFHPGSLHRSVKIIFRSLIDLLAHCSEPECGSNLCGRKQLFTLQMIGAACAQRRYTN